MTEEATMEDNDAFQGKAKILARIYGVLVLLTSGATLSMFVMFIIAMFILKFNVSLEGNTLPIIFTCIQAVAVVADTIVSVILGVKLIRNSKKHIAHLAYVLVALIVVQMILNALLSGLETGVILNLINIAILLVIATQADPALLEERRLQKNLRMLETEQDVEEGTLGRDHTGKGYISLNFLNLFWIFVICSIIGLGLEYIYCFIVGGETQSRAGMLWGPFSPIYGFGAALMTIALNRAYNKSPILIFIVSALIGGAFEFFVSWFLETAFGVVSWDYHGTFLNIDGRTNFMYMCMWGFLGFIWIKFCLPVLLKAVNLIPWQTRYTVTTLCAILMLINGFMTLSSLDCWFERMSGKPITTPIEEFFAEYYPDDFMQHRFANMQMHPEHASSRIDVNTSERILTDGPVNIVISGFNLEQPQK